MHKMSISRKNRKEGISREELERYVDQYLASGKTISKLKSFEPEFKSKAYQKDHLYDIENSDAGIGFTEFSID